MNIGLALGGGGVRGLAHISVLEAFDEAGIRPSIIAGSSMGAIIGAIYASGMPGREIRERITRHTIQKEDTWHKIIGKREDLLRWINAFSGEFSRGGLVNTKGFFKELFSEIKKHTFEELEIPLLVIATDYWSAEEVVFEAGELFPTIQASMAVPGIFAPVKIAGRVLVDGGVVSLVPYERLLGRADITVAVNVSRVRCPDNQEVPNVLESVLGAFDIMQTVTLSEKMKNHPPDIYVRPEIRGVRMLDFSQVDEVFAQAAPAIEKLKMKLEKINAV
jgi:NTE family protein